jgi:hypothetical protein
MNGEEASSERLATPRQAATPTMDPLARDYMVWRYWALLGVALMTVASFALHAPTVKIIIELDDPGEAANGSPSHPWAMLVGLVILFVYYLVMALAGFVLVVAATWFWARLPRSRRLARAAWLVGFLGPLPVFLLPMTHLLDLHGMDAARTAAGQIHAILTVTIPPLLALLPGAARAALVIERFLPESEAPGWLALLTAPFCALGYVLLLGVVLQLSVSPWLVGGLLLLTASPLVTLARWRELVQRDTPQVGARAARSIAWMQVSLSAAGLALLTRYVADKPVLVDLLGHVNIWWFLSFVAGVLSLRILVTVVLVDLFIDLLYRGRESARKLAGTPTEATLDRKITALGRALEGQATGRP